MQKRGRPPLDISASEMAERQRIQKRESAERRRGEDKIELTVGAAANPIPCPSAKDLGTAAGLLRLQHRIVSAVLKGAPGAAEKARVVAPYLRSMAELAKAHEYEALHEAIDAVRRGDPGPARALGLDKQ